MPSVKKIEQKGHISVSFIGEGIVYETLILLSLWDLPALIVVENNNISQSTSSKQNMAGSICDRVKAFDIHYVKTDTYDLDALIETAQQCIHSSRRNQKTQNVQTLHLFVHSHHYQINETTEINAENTPKVHGLKLFVCMVDAEADWHSEALYKYFCHNTARCSKRRKNVLFIPLTNL